MGSLFSELENQLSSEIDVVFGEAFEFRPMIPPPGGGRGVIADNARQTSTVTGIFDDRTFDSKALGSVERTASQVTLRHAKISVDRRQFSAGSQPRQIDRFKRMSTGVVYQVAATHEDSEHRLELRVTEISREI